MIQFYATKWCGDCHLAKGVLQDKGVAFNEIDIDEDHAAAELVRQLNRGMYRVPTIIFDDGSRIIEPSVTELAHKLEQMGL